MTTKLTATQQQVLEHAVQNTDGKIDWFPETLRGGAKAKVLNALLERALICRDGEGWSVAAEGYDAIGASRPKRKAVKTTEPAQPRTRADSKQAQVISMLRRSEGATIQQIMEVTGWQAHTVRGAMAGALKKKLEPEFTITSTKEPDNERVYRIA